MSCDTFPLIHLHTFPHMMPCKRSLLIQWYGHKMARHCLQESEVPRTESVPQWLLMHAGIIPGLCFCYSYGRYVDVLSNLSCARDRCLARFISSLRFFSLVCNLKMSIYITAGIFFKLYLIVILKWTANGII